MTGGWGRTLFSGKACQTFDGYESTSKDLLGGTTELYSFLTEKRVCVGWWHLSSLVRESPAVVTISAHFQKDIYSAFAALNDGKSKK